MHAIATTNEHDRETIIPRTVREWDDVYEGQPLDIKTH